MNKVLLDLNTNKGNKWTIQYGPQDKTAPKSPDELKYFLFKLKL